MCKVQLDFGFTRADDVVFRLLSDYELGSDGYIMDGRFHCSGATTIDVMAYVYEMMCRYISLYQTDQSRSDARGDPHTSTTDRYIYISLLHNFTISFRRFVFSAPGTIGECPYNGAPEVAATTARQPRQEAIPPSSATSRRKRCPLRGGRGACEGGSRRLR